MTRLRDDWLADVDALVAETETERRNLDALLLSDPTPINEETNQDALYPEYDYVLHP